MIPHNPHYVNECPRCVASIEFFERLDEVSMGLWRVEHAGGDTGFLTTVCQIHFLQELGFFKELAALGIKPRNVHHSVRQDTLMYFTMSIDDCFYRIGNMLMINRERR